MWDFERALRAIIRGLAGTRSRGHAASHGKGIGRAAHGRATRSACVGTALALLVSTTSAASPGTVVRLDPRIDRLVPQDARMEKVAEGYTWLEGPVWNWQGGYLLFTDIPDNAVHKWQLGKGGSLFLDPSGYTGSAPFKGREPGANGIAFDGMGRLVLAEHGDRRVTRLEPGGGKITLCVIRWKWTVPARRRASTDRCG